MKTLISSSSLRRVFMLAAFPVLALALSGCELLGVVNPTLDPDRVTTEVEEIPAGYPEGGTIRKTTTTNDSLQAHYKTSVYEYPNGYVSYGRLDPEWRKKKPKTTSEESVDSFNFSGQPGSSGATSGSVIRTF